MVKRRLDQPRIAIFVTDHPEAGLQATCGSPGFTQTSEYMLRSCVELGERVRVLSRSEPAPWMLYVYRP